MTKKEKHSIYLALCISRVLFLFGDYFLSNNQTNNSLIQTSTNQTNITDKFQASDEIKLNQNIESELKDF
jgi:hypothetical protein